MPRVIAYCVALVLSFLLFADRTSAVVVRESVTPASVKEKGSKVSVTAEKHDDGLIHFAITYSLPRPEYLVAHFELRDGETTLVKTDTPASCAKPPQPITSPCQQSVLAMQRLSWV
jgi:hypothetical protein